jgi:hypothetical protein
MAAIKLGKYHDSSFPLDGVVIRVRIHRLTKDEWIALTTQAQVASEPAIGTGPHDDRFLAFCGDTIAAYVSVPYGVLVDGDDQPVTSGQQMVDLFWARQDVMLGLMRLVQIENSVSADQKKVSKSALGSALGWPEWIAKPNGDAPAPTAGPVARLISAKPEGVTERSSMSFGTMDPSSCDGVLCST